MSYEARVIEQYDDTPFTAWFDHFAVGHIHLGYWPLGREDPSFPEAATGRLPVLERMLADGPYRRARERPS